jgi:hypothetical protein
MVIDITIHVVFSISFVIALTVVVLLTIKKK